MEQRHLPVVQASLFEAACSTCMAYDQCGGADTAPCGCIRTGHDYKRCGTCPTSCVEREVWDHGELVDSFRHRLAEGLALATLCITQPSDLALPPLLLTRTGSLPKGVRLEDDWVAVHLRDLLPLVRRAVARTPKPQLDIRSRLRVKAHTNLIAVLNGDDDLLEKLWSMDRGQVFGALKHSGIDVVTGPTFSVYGEGPHHPASHNVTMLQRHHRYCAEADGAGLTVIPNLYWRTRADRRLWSAWLRAHESVGWIARDFSRTKQWSDFRPEFEGLLEIIDGAGRPLNVVATGIGERKMRSVIGALRSVDARCSFVTSRPIVAPLQFTADPPTPRAVRVRAGIAAFRALASDSPLVAEHIGLGQLH